jgi:hypothetical protein
LPYARSLAHLTVPLLTAELLVFEVAQDRNTFIIDPDRSGKTRLDLLVAELVQFFFEEIRASRAFDVVGRGDADKFCNMVWRLARRFRLYSFLLSHSFLSGWVRLRSFPVQDFGDFRFS